MNGAPVFLLSQLPSVLITIALVICGVFAVTKRRLLGPKAAIFAATGLGLLALGRLLGVGYFVAIYAIMALDRPYVLIGALNVIGGLMNAVGLGLLIAAVFVRRPTAAPQDPPAWAYAADAPQP